MKMKKIAALRAKREAELKAKQALAAAGPYELSMTFLVDEVNDVVEQYREEHNLENAEATPEHVAYSVYHGDLIICLKTFLFLWIRNGY